MTIKQIAELAGVSISTVSKVVNNKATHINQETKDRVLRIVKEYNYTPYGAMQTGNTRKTFTLGLLVCSTTKANTFIAGVTERANSLGYGVMLFQSNYCLDQELKHLTALAAKQIDLLIWQPVSKKSLQQELALPGVEQIAVVGELQNTESPFCIDTSVWSHGATEELIALGHRDIALLYSTETAPVTLIEGFKRALLSHHIPYSSTMVSSLEQFNTNSLYNHSPTACITDSYKTAEKLIQKLKHLHIQVPHNLSIIALSEMGDTTDEPTQISTYQIPMKAYGEYVTEHLIASIEHPDTTIPKFTVPARLSGFETATIPITKRKRSIVVVGSLNVDRILNVHELPETGKTIKADDVTILAGGKGVNQAIGVAKLDKSVTLIGKIGVDYDSSIIRTTLENHDVDTATICHDSFTQTGTAYIHIQEDGESSITLVGGANDTLCPEDIEQQEQQFESADFCLLQTEVPIPALTKAAELAKRYGATTILKPAGITKIDSAVLQHIDIVIPNSQEAMRLSGKASLKDQAEFFLNQGVGTVIITRSKDGAYLQTAEGAKTFPAGKNATPIDTTGGADAFIAAFSVYSSLGYPLEVAIRIANIAAGHSVSRFGTFPSMIDNITLDHYIKRMGIV